MATTTAPTTTTTPRTALDVAVGMMLGMLALARASRTPEERHTLVGVRYRQLVEAIDARASEAVRAATLAAFALSEALAIWSGDVLLARLRDALEAAPSAPRETLRAVLRDALRAAYASHACARPGLTDPELTARAAIDLCAAALHVCTCYVAAHERPWHALHTPEARALAEALGRPQAIVTAADRGAVSR